MKELKFRAWVYSMNQMFTWGETLLSIGTNSAWESKNEGNFFADDSVLMQYTGLKDKNGVEIYEGDIISNRWLCEVYKDSNTGAFMVRFNIGKTLNHPRSLYEYLKQRRKAGIPERDNEVIGNVYENPELLK